MRVLKFNKIFWLVIFAFVLCGVMEVNASSIGTTQEYFYSGRNGQELSTYNNVYVNKPISSDYNFALGGGYDSVVIEGNSPLSASEISKWKSKPGEADDYIDIFMSKTNMVSKATDSIKNSFSATYKDAGEYDGTSVDVKVTVVDFAVTSGDFYYKNYAPFIAFLDNPFYKTGVYVMNIDWISLKYEFFESGTTNPINVKGYTTYWDLDSWQGVHILDNNKGIYISNGNKLKVNNLNGAPFVYDYKNADYTGKYNPAVSFTELFEGTSITRVYTPARPVDGMIRNKINRARGMFVNSSVTAVPRKEYAPDTPSGKAHDAVRLNDVIKYKVFYTNVNQEHSADIVIIDTLSKGLTYVKGSSKLGDPKITKNSDGTTTLMWITELAKDSTDYMTYSAKVSSDEDVLVNNKVIVDVEDREYILDPLYNPIPTKNYAEGTPSGKDGLPVKKDDNIRYNIKYANPLKKEQTIVITDVISKGLEYVKKSAKIGKESLKPKVTKNEDGTTTLVWSSKLGSLQKTNLTYMVKVVGGVTKVKNKASIKYENKNSFDLNELINPLPTKSYASDTPYGKGGRTVKEGNTIKYSIKYANTYSNINTVTITDTLSKGLNFVNGSAKIGSDTVDPLVTKNNNGTTTLVWNRDISQGTEEEITYMVSVIGNTRTVKNKASIQYGDKITMKLNELKNPVNIKIRVPDTGSFLKLSGIVFGIALVCGGGYTIYRRYKVEIKKEGKVNEK